MTNEKSLIGGLKTGGEATRLLSDHFGISEETIKHLVINNTDVRNSAGMYERGKITLNELNGTMKMALLEEL